jgi:hypothetical protein
MRAGIVWLEQADGCSITIIDEAHGACAQLASGLK